MKADIVFMDEPYSAGAVQGFLGMGGGSMGKVCYLSGINGRHWRVLYKQGGVADRRQLLLMM